MGREPYEVELGRVVLSACELLSREMDEVFQDLVHRAGTDLRSPYRRPACLANRIVVLCRRISEEIRRYAAIRGQEEGHVSTGEKNSDDAIDF